MKSLSNWSDVILHASCYASYGVRMFLSHAQAHGLRVSRWKGIRLQRFDDLEDIFPIMELDCRSCSHVVRVSLPSFRSNITSSSSSGAVQALHSRRLRPRHSLEERADRFGRASHLWDQRFDLVLPTRKTLHVRLDVGQGHKYILLKFGECTKCF